MGNEQSIQDPVHSLPLIKIINGKMEIVSKLPQIDLTHTKVVSILGKARMGKSSFLNSIITYITGENMNVFATKDDLEHCTSGIDYYYLEKENILLLDSQGLAHEDSSHDPALLLFIYLTSDIIIFNERMMLQNEALNLLQPICAFMNYVELDDIEKPKLFFRISDGDIVKDPRKNLEKLLTSYPDQYQTIRESIQILFEENIGIVRTNTLDKIAKDFLEKNDYQSILSYKDMEFRDAIECILKNSSMNHKQKNAYFKKIHEIVEKINNNEKIKVEKLDVVGLTAKNEIQEWILKIDTNLYAPIEVDGYQKTYEARVEPRKAAKKQTLTNFTKKFKTFPNTVREPYYNELQKKLEEPIKKATEESISLAEARVSSQVASVTRNKKTVKIDSFDRSFTSIPSSFFMSVFQEIHTLENAIKPIYSPVRENYETLIQKVKDAYDEAINKIKEQEAAELMTIIDECKTDLEEMTEWLLEEIKNSHSIQGKSFVKMSIEEITDHYKNKTKVNMLDNHIKEIVVKRQLLIEVNNFVPSYKIEELTQDLYECDQNYDLIKEVYRNYKSNVDNYFNSPEFQVVKDALLKKKLAILNDKLFMSGDDTNLIKMKNPEIKFVKIEDSENALILIGNEWTFMTEDTYKKYYKPFIIETNKALVNSGYITSVDSYDGVNFTKENELPFLYYSNLRDVYKYKLKKMYCKMTMNGWAAPPIWKSNEQTTS